MKRRDASPRPTFAVPQTARRMSPESRPLSAQRRAAILDLLTSLGVVRVVELSERFGVSEVTIRHDLEVLAREGLAVRDHGGAIARTHTPLSVAFEHRAGQHLDAKRRIGNSAAGLVSPGETILLDAGTTVMEMARALTAVPRLTIVTNALNIAAQVGSLPDAHVVLAGGSLSRETLSTLGSLAERDLADLVVDKLFLGAHAIDIEAGITDVALEVARVKQAMIRAAREVILLADSSKWGQRAFAKVAALNVVHTFVTDDALPRPASALINARGIRLIKAS